MSTLDKDRLNIVEERLNDLIEFVILWIELESYKPYTYSSQHVRARELFNTLREDVTLRARIRENKDGQ